jgi:acyl dehydratase
LKVTALDLASVKEGELLAEQAISVSTSRIVASSIAARDFHPLHHNREYARQQGHPDIFLNSLVSGGLVQRYVIDWAGPRARMTSMATRLGVPQYAEDRLVLSGRVTARASDESGWIEVTVTGTNTRGQHLQSVVRLQFETLDAAAS